MLDIQTRNQEIVAEYKGGKPVKEITRMYGVSVRRINQILKESGVGRKYPRYEKKPVSGLHVRIGLMLYEHRREVGKDLYTVSQELGKSSIQVRKLEQGLADIELLDLLEIATYLRVTVDELVEGR